MNNPPRMNPLASAYITQREWDDFRARLVRMETRLVKLSIHLGMPTGFERGELPPPRPLEREDDAPRAP